MPKTRKRGTLYYGASLIPKIATEYAGSAESLYNNLVKPGVLKGSAMVGKAVGAAKRAASKRSTSAAKRLAVGVWDIDVHSGFLNRVLDRINEAQKLFRFHPIEAMVPVGLTFSGDRTRRLAAAHKLKVGAEDLAANALASDIYEAAAPVRKALGIDLLVVVISPMIMDLDTSGGEGESWNLFSTSKDGVVIASAHNLRHYAQKAKRPFEVCLATVVAAAVVQEVYDDVESHEETAGCVFDFCDDRDDIVKGLKKITVCEASLEQIPAAARSGVQKMFDAIREYRP